MRRAFLKGLLQLTYLDLLGDSSINMGQCFLSINRYRIVLVDIMGSPKGINVNTPGPIFGVFEYGIGTRLPLDGFRELKLGPFLLNALDGLAFLQSLEVGI